MSHTNHARIRPIGRQPRRYRALIGFLILVAAVPFLAGCRSNEVWFDVHTDVVTVEVGQTNLCTVWSYWGNKRGEATLQRSADFDWYVSPAEGATCEGGRFIATEPGTYEVSVLRDSWATDLGAEAIHYNSATIIVEEAAAGVALDNHNDQAVQNGGTPPTFEFEDMMMILSVETYHWNDAAGVGETGEISLQADDGTVYGPYATEGREGQGGVPNAYWTATPNVELPPGEYTVIDSDPSTWAQNGGTGGEGMVRIQGQASESEE